jgi:hypothetical protein
MFALQLVLEFIRMAGLAGCAAGVLRLGVMAEEQKREKNAAAAEGDRRH